MIQKPQAPWEVLMRQQCGLVQACIEVNDFSLLSSYATVSDAHPLFPNVAFLVGNGKGPAPPAAGSSSVGSGKTTAAHKNIQARAEESLKTQQSQFDEMHKMVESGADSGQAKKPDWQQRMLAKKDEVVKNLDTKLTKMVNDNIEDINKLPEDQREGAADDAMLVFGWLGNVLGKIAGWLKDAFAAVVSALTQAWESIKAAARAIGKTISDTFQRIRDFFGG